MGYISDTDLKLMGFKAIGKNVKISEKASLYGIPNMEIGNNVRIDDFCIISAGTGGIKIGDNVHIACYVSLIGKEEIIVSDFAGLSARVAVYSSTDDFSGNFLTGPTVSSEFTNVRHGKVYIGKHVIVGVGAVILPNVKIEDGAAIGALSLVNSNVEKLAIAVGVPAKKIKERSRNIFDLEIEYRKRDIS